MNQSRKLKKEIGERVKNERLHKGLSRGDLASEIHASTDTVRKWEDGINMIPVDRIHDISEAVSSPAFQMLGYDDDNIHTTSAPAFRLTDQEEQLFDAILKINPKYTIEAFWLDVVLPGREYKEKQMHPEAETVYSFMDARYVKGEYDRMISVSSYETEARMRDMLHPMRSLYLREENRHLILSVDGKTVFDEKRKKDESVAEFFEHMIFKTSETLDPRFSPNEIICLTNAFGDITGERIFAPCTITEPSLSGNAIHITVDGNSPVLRNVRFTMDFEIGKGDPADEIINIVESVEKEVRKRMYDDSYQVDMAFIIYVKELVFKAYEEAEAE